MTRSLLQISNENEEELVVQVDPFADLFYLLHGQSITIGAHPEDGSDVLFEIADKENYKIIWLPYNSDYFILVDDKEIKYSEYYANQNT